MTGSCALSGGRALHSSLLAAPGASSADDCLRPVLLDVGASSLVAVVTYSKGSVAAQSGWRELHKLSSMLENHAPGSARALLVSKGSRCASSAGAPLRSWFSQGKAHCIQGPNVGARESHTIWAYCHVGSEAGRKKQRWSACTARVTSAALTTSEMFTFDAPCEIICTSMFSSRSAAYTTASVADVETDASFTNETMARCGLIRANDHEGA